MVEDKVVQQLSKDLHSGDVQLQTTAAYHVRDLSTADEDYCRALGTAGVVPALVGLLDTPQKEVTLVAAQALASLSGNPDLRTLIRESGGIPNLVTLLKEAASIREEVVQASLRCLLGIAQDDAGRQAMHAAGVVPPIIKLLGPKTDAGLRQQSVRLLGRMAYNDASKDAVRDAHGIQGLLRILETASGDRGLAETVAQALTILAFNNEMNQDHIREQYGVPLLLKQLESTPFDSLTAAVADAVRSISMNNDANKNAVRENWGIPLLAKMLGPDVALNVQEKAVDCLRILTTGNDANRLALYSNHAAVCAIVRLTQKPLRGDGDGEGGGGPGEPVLQRGVLPGPEGGGSGSPAGGPAGGTPHLSHHGDCRLHARQLGREQRQPAGHPCGRGRAPPRSPPH
eukprot:jgi/Botrbrau1/19665/Bobra.0003s0029.1